MQRHLRELHRMWDVQSNEKMKALQASMDTVQFCNTRRANLKPKVEKMKKTIATPSASFTDHGSSNTTGYHANSVGSARNFSALGSHGNLTSVPNIGHIWVSFPV